MYYEGNLCIRKTKARNYVTHNSKINISVQTAPSQDHLTQQDEESKNQGDCFAPLNFTQLRGKIASGPLISTLECILQLDFKISRISDKPDNHRNSLTLAVLPSIFAHTF